MSAIHFNANYWEVWEHKEKKEDSKSYEREKQRLVNQNGSGLSDSTLEASTESQPNPVMGHQ